MTNIRKKYETSIVKRRLATEIGCKFDLKDELPKLFTAYDEACENYNKEVIQTPPQSRCRGFEASLFNSKLLQSIQKQFPDNWKYGKYKRFILSKNGYLILVKKLNKNSMPMNIKTKFVDSINHQQMGSLFEKTGFVEEPILYFGYKKDRIGTIYSPQLVYIDENVVKWTIDEMDLFKGVEIFQTSGITQDTRKPRLKRTAKKKAVNE